MPDIRQNPTTRDHFLQPPGTDLAVGSDPNWSYTDAGIWTPMEVVNLQVASHTVGGANSSMSSWIGEAFDDDDAEAWARAVGGGVLSGIAWAIGLFAQVGGTNVADGYRMRWEAPGPPYRLQKLTNGSLTDLATSAAGVGLAEHYVLIRRNGNDVEGWVSDDQNDPSAWTMVISATDSDHTTGLYPTIGCTDNSASQILGWQEFGGGPRGSKRSIPQYIRRTHRRGTLWTP